MNITLIGTAFPLRGGIAHYNALLAKALAERHRVQTITFSRQYPSLLFPGKTQEESPGGTDAVPAPQLMDSINPFNWIRVGNLIRKQLPDLLLFHASCYSGRRRVIRNRHILVPPVLRCLYHLFDAVGSIAVAGMNMKVPSYVLLRDNPRQSSFFGSVYLAPVLPQFR